jgi:hypothetical protein
MLQAFRRWLMRDPTNFALVLIGFYCVVTLVDLGFYFSFVARGGGVIVSTLNPLRLVRYMFSPVGILMRVLLFWPLIYLLLFPNGRRPRRAN